MPTEALLFLNMVDIETLHLLITSTSVKLAFLHEKCFQEAKFTFCLSV